ncbi:hypothetical protein WMY93_026606 [Mugilogobius chulae]|uniref:non-specific serine/threonine protein kinase n=1 Tax=Mugilogobius chulae TaxID=88201 RepID=A0AAW0N9W8_9GOBI
MAHNTGTLAKGCFGKIYKEKYNDKWAAIKRVPLGLISRKDLERECEVYKKAEHPNIVKLLGPVTLTAGKYVIPLEFIFGEELETTIFKASKSKILLSPAVKNTIIVGMCEGLRYLHSKDIVHQDLKPDNIMVEHETNRAIIIDLGLAKFFKRGLSSAADMGNEAYAAPEVLQNGNQRDQRSDVWAMGKIIAELCARIRLVTPSVNPEKIKETLKDSPYCRAVCRMVQPDPSLRASMGGVMGAIQVAGVEKKPLTGGTGAQHLAPPANPINARNPSPSPINRAHSPFNRDPSPSPINRAGSPHNRAHSPFNRDPSPFNRDPSPFKRDPSPFKETPLHLTKTPLHLTETSLHSKESPLQLKKILLHSGILHLSIGSAPQARSQVFHHTPQQHHITPSPPKNQHPNLPLVPKGPANVTPDLMKKALYQEAAKDLPCNLPTTGRVVVRKFEEKDGQMELWEQKEVVMRNGRIVKYNDVSMNSN